MIHHTPSTVRRRSASLLVHNERWEDLTAFRIHGENHPRPAFQGEPPGTNSIDERDSNEIHPEGHWICGHDPHDDRLCENCMPIEGHASHHQEESGCPPALDGLQHSPSETRSRNADGVPNSARTNYVDVGHPRLLPSGQLKLTHKWPAPSTLKHLAGSASCKSVDPVAVLILERGQGSALPHSGRWTGSKIWLLVSALSLFTYGTMLLLGTSVTWFDAWPHADVMTVADHDILVLITAAATLLVFSSMVGISGTMLNSRPLLATYTLLLWPDQATILAVGYMAYKRVTFNFDRKMYFAWSRLYTVPGRQIIQDSLHCCGFYNTMHEAAPSKRCFIRASLPGCRDALFDFERNNLAFIWKAAFGLAAIHFLVMIIALLCSNHVTDRFGKGLTPARYRLCSADIKVGSGLVEK